jgi:hypothetical protein
MLPSSQRLSNGSPTHRLQRPLAALFAQPPLAAAPLAALARRAPLPRLLRRLPEALAGL